MSEKRKSGVALLCDEHDRYRDELTALRAKVEAFEREGGQVVVSAGPEFRYNPPECFVALSLSPVPVKYDALEGKPQEDQRDKALKLAKDGLLHMLTHYPLAAHHRNISEDLAAIEAATKEKG